MSKITLNLRLVLSGLCVALMAMVGLELVRSCVEVLTPWVAVSEDVARSPASLSQTAKLDLMSKDILSRPLFNAARRPPQPKKPKIEPPVLHGRLAGIMMRPDAKEALFTRPGGARPVVVKEGEQIDGFTLASVEVDRVILRSSFGDQVFTPTHAAPDEGLPSKPRVIKKRAPTRTLHTPTVAATGAQQVR